MGSISEKCGRVTVVRISSIKNIHFQQEEE